MSRRYLGALLVLCASRSAFAQVAGTASEVAPSRVQQLPDTPRAPRLRFAPWLGFAVPIGSVTPQLAMSELTPPALLIGGDMAWGPSLTWDVGLTFLTSVGLGEPKVCPEPHDSCSLAGGGQVALRGRYYLRPAERVNPWLGLGAGLEVLGNTSATTTSRDQVVFSSSSTTKRSDVYYGPVFGMLQAGVDFRVKRAVTLGGVLGFSLSRFTNVTHTTTVDDQDTTSSRSSVPSAALHQWLFLAVNGTFDARL